MSPIRASERDKYPADWPAIRARILARAAGCCEFARMDGSRCNAPDLTVIARSTTNPETWWTFADAEAHMPDASYYTVKVVLTIAHLNHDPSDCGDENLKAGCQLHHLRYDKHEHQKNAAATRREKKNNGELFSEGRA